ncbi:MAG: NTP transferase domain-containing protein, partial [Chloroflexota bacterium]
MWLYVLARDPAGAKTRLAGILDPDSRARLAAAMLEDILAACADAPFARRIVVTESQTVREIARRAAWETLDAPLATTNDAAAAALDHAVAGGAPRALVLASDLPLLAPADLTTLVAAADTADVVI